MGHQIIKQPDGKYLIFSSIVDNIIATGGTREEIINYYVKRAVADETERVSKLIDSIEAGEKPYLQFGYTFEEVLRTVKTHHGQARVDKILKQIES